MHHSAAKLLQDVVDAAEAIMTFAAGRTLEDFRADDMVRSAVERKFEIIGEALSRLKRLDAGSASQMGEFPKIIAFRNIITHGYDVLDPPSCGTLRAGTSRASSNRHDAS